MCFFLMLNHGAHRNTSALSSLFIVGMTGLSHWSWNIWHVFLRRLRSYCFVGLAVVVEHAVVTVTVLEVDLGTV